jgi:hypothetical protein
MIDWAIHKSLTEFRVISFFHCSEAMNNTNLVEIFGQMVNWRWFYDDVTKKSFRKNPVPQSRILDCYLTRKKNLQKALSELFSDVYHDAGKRDREILLLPNWQH